VLHRTGAAIIKASAMERRGGFKARAL
jgi:hypothetical protein